MKNSVEEFKEAAESYCNWARAGRSSEDPCIALNLLTDVYSKARKLLEVEVNVSDDLAEFTDDIGPIYKRFENLIPFDPNNMEADPVILLDDLTDTYRDLQRGLSLYESGAVDDAIFEWRLFFLSHWGGHALSAMKILHNFVY